MIGSVAVLVLIGILVMLILRHKKQNKTNSPAANGGEYGHGEKEVYYGDAQPRVPRGNEMATNTNAWELEGHVPAPLELETANAYGVKDPKPGYLPRSS